jgi:hypothetical protein|tara:strand:- start:13608 stop:13832 length:225 start_codon:yes stop_codon:yes gene_type:complete
MSIQMYDKQGNSKIVENPQVQDHLRSGWKFKKPVVTEKPQKEIQTKPHWRQTRRIKILKAEANVINNNNNKEDE